EAVVPQQLARVPIAAAAATQYPQSRAGEVRPSGDLRTRDEILHRAPPHPAADDLEAGAAANGGQSRRRAKLTDPQASRVELGRDLGTSEHDPQIKLDALLAEEPLLDPQPQLQAASIGGNAVTHALRHRATPSELIRLGLSPRLAPKKAARN